MGINSPRNGGGGGGAAVSWLPAALPSATIFLLLPLLLAISITSSSSSFSSSFLRLPFAFSAVAALSAALLLLRLLQLRQASRIYLLDFRCYRPGDELKCNFEVSEWVTRGNAHRFSLPSMDFQRKIFERSGLGEETYLPPSLFKEHVRPFEDARAEAEAVLFGSIAQLLTETNIPRSNIAVVITNCSLHSPIPSYAAMVVNRFGLREDCKAIHLGGMGCSASLISCKLAADLLRLLPNQYAIVASTENITLNYYYGNEKPMLVSNCLFRVGCAAILLTNRRSERKRSKYEFLHLVRTHRAMDEKSYGCAYQREDGKGLPGVALNKNLMSVAAEALRINIRTLAPMVLPAAELARYAVAFFCREVMKMEVKEYTPDFKKAVEHFCIHAGGRAVIDEIQKNLYLDDFLLEPARATLHRWGNTSASCLWYVLGYMECKERIKSGDRVWMLGLGSGFKCNSAVLLALRDIPFSDSNAWADCIHRYPAATLTTPPNPYRRRHTLAS